MARGPLTNFNYEEKIEALKAKIEKKQSEVRELKSQLSDMEKAFAAQKNTELLNFLHAEGLDPSRASDLIRKALDMERQQNQEYQQ